MQRIIKGERVKEDFLILLRADGGTSGGAGVGI
jgi:hypothetical protein